jgi:hypothetical protein
MARNGVKVYFECPVPTSREKQPTIVDPKMKKMAKDNIFKVVKHQCLWTMGIKVKSLIKYFAVPKGEDDIWLVYNSTANCLN